MSSTPTIPVTEAIILAGGLGTRLREAVPDLPKCMAPVAGRPFLYHVINALRMQGLTSFVFSLGYKHEVIETYLAKEFATLSYRSVIETEPLGTGGAIALALKKTETNNVLIANGDTLFEIQLASLCQLHEQQAATCTIALKPMTNFDRYGVVETNATGKVTSFREKKLYEQGNINGGIYLIHKEKFLQQSWPEKFSFEKDFLEKQADGLYGAIQEGYFIDIGIPGDYTKAQNDLAKVPLDLKNIDKSWTLFLDRDGVINEDKEGSYIFSPDEFVFMKGAPALFKTLTNRFNRLIITTNQRGIGRGLMTTTTLASIHAKMTKSIKVVGGHLDKIFYAPSVNNADPLRKPNPGMAVAAINEFPDIELKKSIMIGNNISDMQFARNSGMYAVFVRTTNKTIRLPHPDIDLLFDSLDDFTKAL